jgi:uncharacterized delta-60 repeat protein
MSIPIGTNFTTDNLILQLDAANERMPVSASRWPDLTGNLTASLINGPTYSSSNGGTVYFDGVDDYISLTAPASTSWSINCWLRGSNLNSNLISAQGMISTEPAGGAGAEGFFGFFMSLFYNVASINVNSLGEIYVGGQFGGAQSTIRNACVKFNSSGVLDTSFNTSIAFGVVQASSEAFVFDSSGGMYFSGTNIGNMGVRRVNPSTGALISQPLAGAGGGGPSITAGGVLLDEAAGKLWLFGHWATSYNGTTRQYITKVNSSNYSLDTTFDSASGFSTNEVYTAFLDSNKDLYLAGNFTQYKGATASRIVKLNGITAATDVTFSTGTGFNAVVNKIALQSDGKIIAAGNFTNYNGTAINRIVRLNTNGSIDGTFSVGTGFNLVVNTLDIQSDGKIIVVGNFTNYNGTAINRIVRLNTNGSIDGTFSVGTGLSFAPTALKIQSDGKVLVGISATFTYNGSSSYNGLIRLDSAGSIDSTFTIGSGINSPLYREDVQCRLAGGVFQFLPFGANRLPGDTLFPAYTANRMYTFTFDSTSKTVRMYLDASLINTVATTSSLSLTMRPVRITPSGNMGSYMLYSRALTASEISKIFTVTSRRFSQNVTPLITNGTTWGPRITTNNLTMLMDVTNPRSYANAGATIWSDISGNGNNGTLFNSPTYQPVIGGQLSFDGTDDFMDFPLTNFATSTAFTIEGVINVPTFSQNLSRVHWLSGIGGNSMVIIRAADIFIWNEAGGANSLTLSYNFSINTNYHIILTRDTSNLVKLYINGVFVTSGSRDGQFRWVTMARLGSTNTTFCSQMRIAKFAIYSRDLSADEVLQNFKSTKTRYNL